MIIYDYVSRAELKPDHIVVSLRWLWRQGRMINLDAREEAPGTLSAMLQAQVHCSGRLQEGRGHKARWLWSLQSSVRNAVGFHCSLVEWLNEYFYWVVVSIFMIKEIWLNLRIPVYIQEADFWINSPPAPPTPHHPVLGLCYCVRAFSSCDEWGLLCCGGLSCCEAWAPEHGLGNWVHGLSCSAACGIFPDQGSNPCPPVLAGGFSTTGPPGKSDFWLLLFSCKLVSDSLWPQEL